MAHNFTTAERKAVTSEDVPPGVMELIDELVRRHGIRKASLLIDKMGAIYNKFEEMKK